MVPLCHCGFRWGAVRSTGSVSMSLLITYLFGPLHGGIFLIYLAILSLEAQADSSRCLNRYKRFRTYTKIVRNYAESEIVYWEPIQ